MNCTVDACFRLVQYLGNYFANFVSSHFSSVSSDYEVLTSCILCTQGPTVHVIKNVTITEN